ncbi:MAG: YdcF family protein [Polyangia bacterium]
MVRPAYANALECRCHPSHRGRPVDVGALNARWRGLAPERGVRWPFLVVPGYTPRLGWSSGLHPEAAARLEQAAIDVECGLASTIIVSGGAVHSSDNEALLMRAWLVERGVDPARILVEPCARHTTTNLRNAGRMVLAAGASEALVVTNGSQTYYLAFPWRSSFHVRCLAELGYRVGALEWLGPMHIAFRPSAEVFRASWKETRAGDP